MEILFPLKSVCSGLILIVMVRMPKNAPAVSAKSPLNVSFSLDSKKSLKTTAKPGTPVKTPVKKMKKTTPVKKAAKRVVPSPAGEKDEKNLGRQYDKDGRLVSLRLANKKN